MLESFSVFWRHRLCCLGSVGFGPAEHQKVDLASLSPELEQHKNWRTMGGEANPDHSDKPKAGHEEYQFNVEQLVFP